MTAFSFPDVPGLRLDEPRPGVLLVTLDRPEQRNALNYDLRRGLVRLCRGLADDRSVRALVLTGADPAFCGGVDLREQLAPDARPRPERTNPAQTLRTLDLPVIGAINGPCVTGGLEVALSCAFLIASERATFADTHARLGLVPGWGMSALLPRAVGVRTARRMTLTGEPIDASTALALGLVTEVVPHAELLGRALAVAEQVASCDERAARASMRLYASTDGTTLAHALGVEADTAASWSRSADGTRDRFAGMLRRDG
ncbi:enoyl-CoA hydratase [Cryptosporangium aurantiacum]|uniref:Enoyl-CoA hydratase n=1 Tax=Cryptosporangium aurantiacum TaxID=134849 RepID=A0A1M7PJT0_9ACTN|nr:enoyl-CoA hydratase [Cryptosporangium aurantiacum]SHN17164.1 enoyl-CoA hydratase [Cryptosporangium aurantiacum]